MDKKYKDPKDLVSDLEALWEKTTKGQWQKGLTSHETVVKAAKGDYLIGMFHHAADAAFCDAVQNNFEQILSIMKENNGKAVL